MFLILLGKTFIKQCKNIPLEPQITELVPFENSPDWFWILKGFIEPLRTNIISQGGSLASPKHHLLFEMPDNQSTTYNLGFA